MTVNRFSIQYQYRTNGVRLFVAIIMIQLTRNEYSWMVTKLGLIKG